MVVTSVLEKEVLSANEESLYTKVYVDNELKFICFDGENRGLVWEIIKGGKDDS